ncbi:pyrroloquinoline quinone biosynthesis protein PqqE, partial [Bartonella sp. M0193]|nr:pyrroloquinoline quinone biosynthesis protein PqqE [Bartonella sp. M0193]
VGDASATDPACIKSPFHQKIRELGEQASHANAPLQYRRIGVF